MIFHLIAALFLASTVFATHSADLNGDGRVNQADLSYVIAQWRGPGGTPNADLNHDGTVNTADAGILFSSWGTITPPSGSTYRLTTDLGVPTGTNADVSDRVAAAIRNVAKPATILLEGTYRIDHAVNLENISDYTLKSATGVNGGFVRLTQELRPLNWPQGVPWFQYLQIRGSSNVTLENFSIAGPLATVAYDQERESAHGLQIAGASTNIIARDIRITGVHGDFLTVSEHAQGRPSAVLIERMTGDIAGRQMIAPTGTTGLIIRNSRFTRAARSAVDVEPSNALGSENITIEDSYISGYTNYGLAGGGQAAPHNNLVVRRTTFKGGRSLAKWPNNPNSTTPTHVGFRLEDVVYDYVSPEYMPDVGNSPGIIDAQDIHILRTTMHFRSGGPGSIMGTGEVRDSTFTADNTTTGIIYCIYGLTASNNIGAEVAPTANCQ